MSADHKPDLTNAGKSTKNETINDLPVPDTDGAQVKGGAEPVGGKLKPAEPVGGTIR